MAEKERKLVENIALLPDALKDEFLSQLEGAATAVKVLAWNQATQKNQKSDAAAQGV